MGHGQLRGAAALRKRNRKRPPGIEKLGLTFVGRLPTRAGSIFIERMRAFILGVLALVSGAWTVCADINVNFASTSSTSTTTLWNYTINVTSFQEAHPGDFFTIYDFGNIIPASNVQPAGWTFSTSLLGPTPAQINAPDNPAILNLTWTYNGPIIPSSTLGIGPFQVAIAGPGRTQFRNSYFAGQGTMSTGPSAGSVIGNIAPIVVPREVPEPATFALIFGVGGLGLVGRALARRRRL